MMLCFNFKVRLHQSMAPSMNFESNREYGRVLNQRWILSDGWHRWGVVVRMRTRRKAREMRERKQSTERKSTAGIRPIRICANCHTSKTPLWRSGPTGPKSLCNACGIKSRKRQMQYETGETKHPLTSSSSSNFLTMEELKQLQKEKQINMLKLHAKHRTQEIIQKRKKLLEASSSDLAKAAMLLLSFSKGISVISKENELSCFQ